MSGVATRFTPFTTTPVIGTSTYPDDIDVRNTEMESRMQEIDGIGQEINDTSIEINEDLNLVSAQVVVMSAYVAETKDYKNEAQGYSNAAQTSYENTVSLIESTDITGTAGYTISAVDDLFSRQRNLQFVGLT